MAWIKKPLKRSYKCNTDLLVQFRELRGWTQADLAKVSGYTERLISKAETGGSISSETVGNLAEALYTSQHPVYPEDLINEPVLLARKCIEALHRHHEENFIHKIRDIFAEDIVLKMAGDPRKFPFSGEYRGISEVESCWKLFFSLLEIPEGIDHNVSYSYFGQGLNEVLVRGKSFLQPIGRAVAAPPVNIMIHIKFCRGKIILFDDVFDSQKDLSLR